MSDIFDGLVLHPEASTALQSYIAQPVHAVLIEGSIGLGKSLLASRVAAAVLDISPDKLATYPYVRVLLPEKQAIQIEQIRALHAFFARTVPGKGTFKRVVIIPDAELMTIPAQNALLKLLEEPPSDTAFILTSSRAQKLLPTIISRSRVISIHAPSDDAIREHFVATHDAEDVQRAQLLAGHNIARLEALLNGATANAVTLDLVKHVLTGSTYAKLLLLGKAAQDKDTLLAFVDTLAEVVNASLNSSAHKGGASVERWQQAQAAVYTAASALRKNGSPKLVMTELALAL